VLQRVVRRKRQVCISTRRTLERRGVESKLGVFVASADDGGVTLADGTRVAGATNVWAGGVAANPLVASLPFADKHGKVWTPSPLLERLAAAMATRQSARTPTQARTLQAAEQEFESRLRFRLGTHVALRRSGAGGKIEIKFGDENDLIRVADIILGEEAFGERSPRK